MKRLALAVLASLAACGGGGTVAPVTYADYIQQSAQYTCQAIFDCCDKDRIADTSDEYTDVPSCVAYFTGDDVSTPLASAYAFDGEAAAKCLARMKSDVTACKATLTQTGGVDDCADVITGVHGDGASCSGDVDETACAPGFVCNDIDGLCHKPVAVGQACGDSANGATCAASDYCDQDGTCHKLGGVGDACDENYACDNLNCSVNDGTKGTCQAVPDDVWVCFYDPS